MATEDYSLFNKPLAFAGATNIDESAVPPLPPTEQEEPSPTRFRRGVDYEQAKALPPPAAISGSPLLDEAATADMPADATDPRQSTIKTPIISFGRYLSPEPALSMDPDAVKYTYSDPFLGAQGVKTRMRPVAKKELLTPIITIQSLLDEGDIDQQDILDASFVMNARGEKTTFLPSDTLEDRLQVIDDNKGTSLHYNVRGRDGSILREDEMKIPYGEIIDDLTQLPDDIREHLAAMPFISDEKTYSAMMNLGYDEETNRAIFAYKLNEFLEAEGLGERARAGVIMHSVGLPQFGATGFNDLGKLAGIGTEVMRFPFEGTAYILGEAYGGIMSVFSEEWSNAGIADSVSRQQFFERFFPRMPAIIQDRYTQLNLDVPYHVAESLARRFSGAGAQTAATMFEIKGGSALASFKQTLGAASEIRLFEQHARRYARDYPDMPEEDVIAAFKDIRNKQFLGMDVSGVSDSITAFTLGGVPVGRAVAAVTVKPTAKINSIRISSRLKSGMQLADAAREAGDRIRVTSMQRALDDAIAERNRIVDSQLPKKSYKDAGRLEKVNKKIDALKMELRAEVAASEVPQFLRDIRVSDAYITVGSSAGYQAFAVFGGDPTLGELFGAGTGIVATFLRSGNDAEKMLKKYNLTTDMEERDLNLASMLLNNMTDMSPEFRAAVNTRIEYFNGLKQELIQAGVRPEVLERSAARIMGLSVLQVLEEGMRLNLDAPSSAAFKGSMEMLEENLATQRRFAADLREAMRELAKAEGVDIDGHAVKKLYDTIDAAVTAGDSMIKQLDSDLDVLARNYEKAVHGLLLGTSEGMSLLDAGSQTELAKTFENLAEFNIKKVDKTEINQVRKEVNRTHNGVANAITQKAKQLSRILPTQGAVRTTIRNIIPQGTIFKPGREPLNITEINTASNAFAALTESARVREAKKPMAIYGALDNQVFSVPDGAGGFRRVMGNATVDAGPILDKMFAVLGTDDGVELLLEMSEKSLRSSTVGKSIKFLDNAAGGFLASVAEGMGKSVDDVIDEALASASELGIKIDPRVPRHLAAAQVIREQVKSKGMEVSTIPMSFTQVKELGEAFSHIGYRLPVENRQSKLVYQGLEDLTEAQLENFEVVDPDTGARYLAGDLFFEYTDPATGQKIQSTVRNGLQTAKQEWSEYKRRFFNDENIGKWMGWKSKDARLPTQTSPAYPLGIDYGSVPPEKWLDFNAISKLNVEDGQRVMKSINEAIGERGADGVYRINVASPDGQAMKAILEARLREHLTNILAGENVDFNKIRAEVRNLQRTFIGVNDAGKEVAFIDADKVLKDVFPEFGEGAVDEKILNAGNEKFNSAKQRIAAQVQDEVKVVKKGIAESVKFLQAYSSEAVDVKNVGLLVTSGGTSRVGKLRQHLIKLGNTKEEVDEILKAMVIQTVEERAFKLTGKHDIDPNNPNVLIPEVDLDENALKEMMGYNNRETQAVMREILGDDTYDFYEKIVDFVSNERLNAASNVQATGIPREFSLESYISRFYAVNRGVVSFRYVGTEAVLQSMRRRNMSILMAALTSPKVGELFLEMINTGQPLPADKEAQLFNLLVVAAERADNYRTNPEKDVKVVHGFGHEFTFNLTIP